MGEECVCKQKEGVCVCVPLGEVEGIETALAQPQWRPI